MSDYFPFPGAYLAPVTRRPAASTAMSLNRWPFGNAVQGVGNGVTKGPIANLDPTAPFYFERASDAEIMAHLPDDVARAYPTMSEQQKQETVNRWLVQNGGPTIYTAQAGPTNGGTMDIDTAIAILSGVTASGTPVVSAPADYQAAYQWLAANQPGLADEAGFVTPDQYAADYAAAHPAAAAANGAAPAASAVLPLAAAAVAAWFLLKK